LSLAPEITNAGRDTYDLMKNWNHLTIEQKEALRNKLKDPAKCLVAEAHHYTKTYSHIRSRKFCEACMIKGSTFTAKPIWNVSLFKESFPTSKLKLNQTELDEVYSEFSEHLSLDHIPLTKKKK
jgi:hypothetical protein